MLGVTVCVFSVFLWVKRIFRYVGGKVHRTWEQYHNDQVNTLKLYPFKDSNKQIIFEDILTITGAGCCMYYETVAVFVKYKVRRNAA
jgi:Holliday junction resolvasome RuvABC DNA-binding subunit